MREEVAGPADLEDVTFTETYTRRTDRYFQVQMHQMFLDHRSMPFRDQLNAIPICSDGCVAPIKVSRFSIGKP